MPEFLFVPYLGTAEKEVILVDWLVPEGDSFAKGQPLCVVETLKASFEIEAEKAGILFRHMVDEGERLVLQTPLAVFGDEGEAFDEASLARLQAAFEKELNEKGGGADSLGEAKGDSRSASKGASRPESKGGRAQAAPAARRKARELGIDLDSLRGTGPQGLIRMEDVLAATKNESPKFDSELKSDGFLDPSFLEFLRAEGEQFSQLSSEFRLALYRKYGAKIGPSAFLGKGAWILAERLVLGRGFRLGAGGKIEAQDFVCGDLVQFGPRLRLRCRKVRMGSNAYFAPDVEIGGGGAMDPEAELRLGSHGFVGEHVHLNPCRPLIIGDEVVLSRQASLMTHSFGLDVFEGYPNRFAGIRIEDCCQIGISCTLFPGVAMGRGSILLSGSSLVTDVPEGRLFGGVPAKDMKAARRDLNSEAKIGLARGLLEEFVRQLQLRGLDCSWEEDSLLCEVEGRQHRLLFVPELSQIPAERLQSAAEWILVSMDVAEQAWEGTPSEGILVDLGNKRIKGVLGPLAASFREFLRKRGVRLEPRSWTYEGGWL